MTTSTAPTDAADIREFHAFMLELGRALSLAGTAVSETQDRLTTVAAASGASDARIVVLPTTLMIAFGRAGWTTIESIPQLAGALRLDQISTLYDLVHEAEQGAVEPSDGLRRLRRISKMPARPRPLPARSGSSRTSAATCGIRRARRPASNVRPQDCRHSRITHLHAAGVDDADLAAMSGH